MPPNPPHEALASDGQLPGECGHRHSREVGICLPAWIINGPDFQQQIERSRMLPKQYRLNLKIDRGFGRIERIDPPLHEKLAMLKSIGEFVIQYHEEGIEQVKEASEHYNNQSPAQDKKDGEAGKAETDSEPMEGKE